MISTVREWLEHPGAQAAAVAGAFATLLKFGVAKAFVLATWQSAGTLFSAASISAFTLPEIFPQLEPITPVLKVVVAVVGVVYLAKLAKRVYENYDNRL